MRKVDGHTHTHYCPHGSGEHVEEMIIRAMGLGFTEYHITEHPPLPYNFTKELVPQSAVESITMDENQVDDYVKEMLALKDTYKSKMNIKVGFEIDYLPEHVEWTKNFLREYGPYCDTGILSVHFMKGLDAWRCIDYQAEDTKEGLVHYYGNGDAFQLAYYDYVQQSILEEMGPYKPKRIGHMTLCNKFKQYLHLEESEVVQKKIMENLLLIKQEGYELDFNTAGLFKPYCGETYPSVEIVKKTINLGIPMVYGSDAHSIEDVGRGYEVYSRK